jgi:hypothetical protein
MAIPLIGTKPTLTIVTRAVALTFGFAMEVAIK